ncbi:hypothetical protein BJX63DRAFT_321014 [Aspergillus granulosus]|uniref:Uncharacterized protein n=1 Tax=Aspergillus granulosus TaxID=176169 RepID=A0ABR4H4E8_9EURO
MAFELVRTMTVGSLVARQCCLIVLYFATTIITHIPIRWLLVSNPPRSQHPSLHGSRLFMGDPPHHLECKGQGLSILFFDLSPTMELDILALHVDYPIRIILLTLCEHGHRVISASL